VKMLQSKEFWMGAGALFLVMKFGDKLPVVGPFVSKLKV
jgi:hypothetical protein